MSSAAARSAIEVYLAANWSTLPLVSTDNVNISARPPLGFVAVAYNGAKETCLSLGRPGTNRYREDGQAQVTVFVPVGAQAHTTAETYANQIRAVFRGRHFSGVRVHGVPGSSNASDGRFYCASFAVPYTFDNAG
jgi:hypothetical protein